MCDKNWFNFKKSWYELLEEVDSIKGFLKCSYSGAWYRGQTNSECKEGDSYNLLPSLFRKKDIRLEEDLKHLNNLLLSEDKKYKQHKRKFEKLQKKIYNQFTNNGDELDLHNKLIVEKKLRDKYRSNRTSIKSRVRSRKLLYKKETDIFNAYSSKIGGSENRSSWEILAEMRHHNIATRLLDWTEVLYIALYFALEKYIHHIEKQRNKIRDKSLYLNILDVDLGSPSLQILNAYELSRYSTKKLRIWNVTRDTVLDYYNNFIISKSWHFDYAIPIYSPWKYPRISAQRGVFTVHGYNREPLEDQIKNSKKIILKEIKIDKKAAIYGSKILLEYAGYDRYYVYKDIDSLGEHLESTI